MNKGMEEEWGVYVEEVVQKDDIYVVKVEHV